MQIYQGRSRWIDPRGSSNRKSTVLRMLFVHVDDTLALGHNAKEVKMEITQYVRAKEGSMKPPKIYLGADISKLETPYGREIRATSPRTYVRIGCDHGIGILRWAIEFGRIDISLKVSFLSQYELVTSRQGIIFLHI